jgi:hypothetical protein|tara:strand:+ start:276 stop:500 length:225 start_codon:yes stop_codon:yes gene_type:complete
MNADIPATITRDERMPLVEQVREIACEYAGDDEFLDFVSAALALGCTAGKADAIGEELNERMQTVAERPWAGSL